MPSGHRIASSASPTPALVGARSAWAFWRDQDTLAVPSMALKLAAQLAGLGCGYLPEPLARPHIASGALVAKAVEQPARIARVAYAWRAASNGPNRPRPAMVAGPIEAPGNPRSTQRRLVRRVRV